MTSTRRSFLSTATAATVAAAVLPIPAIAGDTERTDVLDFDLNAITDGRATGLQIPVTLQRTTDGRYVLVLHEFNEARYDELAANEREGEYDFERDDFLHDLPLPAQTAAWLIDQIKDNVDITPPPPPPAPKRIESADAEPPYVLGLRDGVFGDVWTVNAIGELSRRGPGAPGAQWDSREVITSTLRLERTRTGYLFEAGRFDSESQLFTDTRWIRIPTDIGDKMTEAIITPPGRWTQDD